MITARKKRTLAERLRDGEIQGMTPGFPPHMQQLFRMIDTQAASECECLCCHHHGMHVRPYHSANPVNGYTYRVYTLCPNCGHTDEF